jgi:phosphate:Na+ symporter
MINGLLHFLAGLTLFLFSMMRLSTLMQQVLSARIRQYILFSVRRPLSGMATGMLATVLFQSSSTTTLLTVGLVSAGLISFYQSLGIILGADIGTTLTAQLVVWKVTDISPLFVFLGGLLWLTGRGQWKTAGEALLYFGLIFFGLSLSAEATAPLKASPLFTTLIRQTTNPFLGVGVGLLFTAIVHASSIPVSILVILGSQGLITIESALPIIFGANIGTSVTAILGSMAASIDAKRSALSHALFKVFGAAIALALLPLFAIFLKYLSGVVPQQIALGHLIFNLLIVAVFAFLLKPFSRLMTRLVPGISDTIPLWPEFLETRCLSDTTSALLCVRKELVRELSLAKAMLARSLELIPQFREARKGDILYIEMVVDNLQLEITRYLWSVSCNDLSPALSKRLFAYSQTVYDIERIGDHATNIVDLAESRQKRHARFSEAAMEELRVISGLVTASLEETHALMERRDDRTLRRIRDRGDALQTAVNGAIEKHLERFYQKICPAEAGPIFVDILINLRRISEHCTVIAQHLAAVED